MKAKDAASKGLSCGHLSLILALLGVSFEVTALHLASSAHVAGWIVQDKAGPYAFVLFLAGTVLSITGLARKERARWLCLIGLALNISLVVLGAAIFGP